MDCVFQDHKLSQMQLDVPYVGLCKDTPGQIAFVKKFSHELTKAHIGCPFYSMQIVWEYDTSLRQAGFVRKLQQEITKPLNIHLSMTKMPGFNYRLRAKENVVISRLLVTIRDIDEAIDLLIDEANRFYILYCHTL